MTLDELASIAARYATAMADAMLAAVCAKASETGEPLPSLRRGRARRRGTVAMRVERHGDVLSCMAQRTGVTGL